MSSVLGLKNVTKSFGGRRVLDDISLEIQKGEILFILGKSGVGKSVTLKHWVGMVFPDQGQVFVGETPVDKQADLSTIRKKCGMVFQHPALLDSLTAFENIAFGLKHLGRSEIESRVREALAQVHLEPQVLDKKPNALSYGTQKRVSLARTLAPKPEILLFDEPTTGLDPVTTQSINKLIFELSRRLNVTSVVVSHDMGCALAIADRVVVLDQGKILAQGSPTEMKNSKESLVRDFLSEVM